MKHTIPMGPISGMELRRLRERIIVNGEPMKREQFAALHNMTTQQLKNYENEKRGAMLKGPAALLVRITCDPLCRAQWLALTTRYFTEEDPE